MAKIEKDTLIGDVIELNPNAPEILFSYGMHCLGCIIASGETVEQAAEVHGIDVDQLLEDLNK